MKCPDFFQQIFQQVLETKYLNHCCPFARFQVNSAVCCVVKIITIHCPLIENIIVMPPKLTFDRVIGAIEDVIITEEFQVQKRNKMNSDLMKLKILLPSST